MSEEDDRMGRFESVEVNMKISANDIDLMLTTQELQDPAPDVSCFMVHTTLNNEHILVTKLWLCMYQK